MKKLFIATAAACAFAGLTAQAENETTLYGSVAIDAALHGNIKTADGKAAHTLVGSSPVKKKSQYVAAEENVVKFGIKGKEEINDQLTAVYKIELNGNGKRRYAYVGLTGPWGTLQLGTQDSLFKVLNNYNDIFQNSFWGEGTYFIEGLSRPDRVIAYLSPSFSGFQFGLAGILNGDNGVISDTHYDDYFSPLGGVSSRSSGFGAAQAGVWYAANGFFGALSYEWIKADADLKGHTKTYKGTELIGATFGYSNDQFKAGFNAEHKTSVGEKYNLAGEYYFGPNTIRAGVGHVHTKAGNPDLFFDDNRGWTYALGYQYNFSKRTYTYVEGTYVDYKHNKAIDKKDGYEVRVGLRHDF